MRNLLIFLASVIICSCGKQVKNEESLMQDLTSDGFEKLIANLQPLDTGYTYDMVKQDTEGSYRPKDGDTLYYNPPFSILGILKDTTAIRSIIHFEPGDDMHPVLRTFSRDGKQIDQAIIAFGNCAGEDCAVKECSETFKITGRNTIEDVLTMVITPCDDSGNKQSNLSKKETRRKKITVNNDGKITVEQQDE